MNKSNIAQHIATLANLYQATKTEAERQAIAERLLEESQRLTGKQGSHTTNPAPLAFPLQS